MGLRLYTAPVESDVQAKPEAEKTSSHARSAIRRTRTVRQAYADLDSRRRAAIAAATEERISGGRRRLADDFNRGFADTSAPGPSEPSGRTLPSSADSYAQARAVAIFHERFDRLHAAAISNQPSNENSRVPGSSTRASGGILPESSVRDWESSSAGPRRPLMTSSATVRAPPVPPAILPPVPGWSPPRNDLGSNGDRRSWSPYSRATGRPTQTTENSRPTQSSERTSLEEAQLDGLGDRNRSLSPEGDNVWDTLLTTLTPDPQPPSVGSSFASTSTSTSGGASQSVAAGSSGTSLTGPEVADGVEAQGESGCENSDTDGDEDYLLGYVYRNRLRSRRSYADVAAEGAPSSVDDPMELQSMQRIVRNLAQRRDIPDEWWAEAGLSRTLSREAFG